MQSKYLLFCLKVLESGMSNEQISIACFFAHWAQKSESLSAV